MVDRKRILFVDDEPRILNGLRRMLRSVRREWETLFALGADEALNILGQNDVDVIVSDMRMPGMSGFELLQEVRQRHPRTICFALSGQASKSTVLGCISLAHQYLTKPCNGEALKLALSRIFALETVLPSERLKNIITEVVALPSLPWLYDGVLEELRSTDVSMKAVAQMMSQDVGMSLQILRLAASAFSQGPLRMRDAAYEATFLGVDIVRELVGSPHALCRCDRPERESFSLAETCNHATTVGRFAKRIAEIENAGREMTDAAYVAGLLHDVGKVILATRLPEEYDTALSRAKEQGMSPLEAENETFHAAHTQAGAYLLGLWGLPDTVVQAAAFHHKPSEAPAGGFNMVAVVHVADVLANQSETLLGRTHPLGLNESDLAELSLTERVSVWREACLVTTAQETKDERQDLVC